MQASLVLVVELNWQIVIDWNLIYHTLACTHIKFSQFFQDEKKQDIFMLLSKPLKKYKAKIIIREMRCLFIIKTNLAFIRQSELLIIHVQVEVTFTAVLFMYFEKFFFLRKFVGPKNPLMSANIAYFAFLRRSARALWDVGTIFFSIWFESCINTKNHKFLFWNRLYL